MFALRLRPARAFASSMRALSGRQGAPYGVRTLATRPPPRGAAPDLDENDDQPDFLEAEHPAVMRRIDAVKLLHERHTALRMEMADKVEALEDEYDRKCKPLLARRAQIVMGVAEPTDDEARPLSEYLAEMQEHTGEAEVGIPGFWLTAITEHEALADAVTEEDAAVLEYLIDVSCDKFKPGAAPLGFAPPAPSAAQRRGGDASDEGLDELPGFVLTFTFRSNPYFANTELAKVVWLEDDYPAATKGTPIKWASGKDVTHRTVVKHSKRQNRKVKTLERTPSFFHFFEARTFDMDEDELAAASGGNDPNAEAGIDSQVQASLVDLRMTLTFRDELVPSAAEWAAVIEEADDDER